MRFYEYFPGKFLDIRNFIARKMRYEKLEGMNPQIPRKPHIFLKKSFWQRLKNHETFFLTRAALRENTGGQLNPEFLFQTWLGAQVKL